ncbi:hypothetical protein HPB49_025402 [Dermacentor silvarum]|uniref:Uncharacterized protein n=1 Tax=Dermacentor silvarum TaxID=543639 RepID=A0ACB8CIK1_DERSI|nr:spindle and kinetochore-associated protein 1 [Dermacentor silvarum]KAH7942574.1 hypothetical protein HPB49_025402 [Dermacentor silvarum]
MTDEYIAHLHRRLDVLNLCVGLSKVSADDAYFVKDAQAKLQRANEHQRRIRERVEQHEQVKEQEANLLAELDVRLQLAECQKAFLDSLIPQRPAHQQNDVARGNQGNGSSEPGVGGDRPQASQRPAAGPRTCTNYIAHLSEGEFAHVPKYMKGRFTLAALNKLVDAFNKALASKYELLALPKSRLKEAQWKRVTAYNQQETAETKRLCFLVDDDLTKGGVGGFESIRIVTQFIVVMRHCGRIREIRGPERIVRYVVV